MILQSGQLFKTFAEQKAFSFVLDASFDNTSGVSNFKLLGETGDRILFSFSSGRIMDPKNRFVDSYSSFEEITISGDINSGDIGYYINNSPVCLNLNFAPSDSSFEALSFSTTGTQIDFSIDVWGESLPSYELTFPNSAVLTGQTVTGYLKNNSSEPFQSFKIFSGSSLFLEGDYSLSSNLQGVKIKPGESGALVFEYDGGGAFQLDQNKQARPASGVLFLHSSFGDVNLPVVFPLKSSPFYFLDFQQEAPIHYSETGTLWSFEIERQACSGTRFNFVLDDIRWLDPYYSFSDSFLVRSGYNNDLSSFSSVPYNSSLGAFTATGFIPGAGCSGDDSLVLRFDILSSHPSGVFLNKFKYSISGLDDQFLFDGFLSGVLPTAT